MAGELKIEILFKGSVYVLNRMGCANLLIWLEHEEPEIGAVMVTLRDDLRKALMDGAPAPAPENPFADESEEPPAPWIAPKAVIKNVAKENSDDCGDCRIPKCRFCDQPGTRAGGRKDGAGRMVERYYICNTEGCLAAKMKTPQPMALFAGGN
jgi:hypothetical protein